MSASIPLLSHGSAAAVIAQRAGSPITVGAFLADVRHVAARLPEARHVLNLCADRYHFAVGLSACLVSRKICVMPPGHAPEALRQIAATLPDVFCLTDAQAAEGAPRAIDDGGIPRIDAGQTAALLYTSGSTGAPVAHAKTWGRLVRCIRHGAALLGVGGRPHAVIGTVPPQHMYGLESTVLLPLQSGGSFCAERPFYPADVCAAVAAAPRPRILVSTPVHLRALVGAEVDPPPVDLIVSATAPLAQDLARQVEARFAAPLREIYGSTETGQIAGRRTRDTEQWRLWPEVRLEAQGGTVVADGGHLERRTALADRIEITGPDTFRLHGRTADLVNIAGKRSSFAYLNHLLNAVPGVLDGVFFESRPSARGVPRLAAAVVAPGMSVAALTALLRARIDPVFLPRPLIMVARLPRNDSGKLPLEALQALLGPPR